MTPSADLYGPFWTLTTLIFTLYLSSSLGASISSFLSDPDSAYDYDFSLLSISVTLVYAYGIGLPVLLWIALRYLGVGEWSPIEAVAVWGYAMFVWIPVSVRLDSEGRICVCVFIVTDPPTDFMRDTRTHPSLGACGRCICPLGVLPGSKRIPNPRICESSLPTQIFSYRPVYPLFQAEAKPTRLIIILIGVLHAGLALTFKVLFFSYYVVKSKEPDPLST